MRTISLVAIWILTVSAWRGSKPVQFDCRYDGGDEAVCQAYNVEPYNAVWSVTTDEGEVIARHKGLYVRVCLSKEKMRTVTVWLDRNKENRASARMTLMSTKPGRWWIYCPDCNKEKAK